MRSNLKTLFNNIKAKINNLEGATISRDLATFAFTAKEIQTLFMRVSEEMGLKIACWPEEVAEQHHSKPNNLESLRIDQKSPDLSRRVDDLNLSIRAEKCLKALNITYIGELVQISESELMGMTNFGGKSLVEIKQKLRAIGLNIDMQIPNLHGFLKSVQEQKIREKNIEKAPLSLPRQKSRERLHFYPTEISRGQFIKLLRVVDELDLSTRSVNVLKTLGIKYIGDLVHLTEWELLQLRNFGKKSILEIQAKLKNMDLFFGMNILGWPPDDTNKLVERYATELEKVRKQEELARREVLDVKVINLEDEFYECLGSLEKNKRDTQIISRLFGWDGNEPKTLEAVGKEFHLTRERVRQIRNKFKRKFYRAKRINALKLPILESALQFVAQNLPVPAHEIELKLFKEGISRKFFRLEGLLANAKFLDLEIPFCIATLSGKRFAVKPKTEKLPKLILNLSNKSIEHWGVATVSDIVAQVAQKTDQSIDENFAQSVISSSRGFYWLDRSGKWFWLSTVSRNRVLNQVYKILSVSNRIDIAELRAGVGRHHRMEGFSPPKRVLLELCRHASLCEVGGSTIIAHPSLDWEQILSDTERIFAVILKEHGPVMSRKQLQKMCLNSGMNESTFSIYLSYSPIITKYAIGVYGLRGEKIQPGIVESLKPKRKLTRILVDFGWTPDEKIWLGHQISPGMMLSGVFTVPAAMKEFLQGNFTLEAADEAHIGNLKIKDSSGWNLGNFFRRRGGEPGDHLVLTFDLTSRKAKVYVGDEDLLEDFRPEN